MRRTVVIAFGSVLFACGARDAGASTPPPCRTAALVPALGPEVSEATGQHTLTLRLVNRAPYACRLFGYPKVILSDRAGVIPFTIRHGGDQMVTARPPTRVVVRPGGGAFVVLNNYRCDLGTRRAATTVHIELPGTTQRRAVSIALADRYRRPNWCGSGDPGSTLTVSPFEPTLRAALRG